MVSREFGDEGEAKEGGEIAGIFGEGSVEVMRFARGIEIGEGERMRSRRHRQNFCDTSEGCEILDCGGMRSQPEAPGGTCGS